MPKINTLVGGNNLKSKEKDKVSLGDVGIGLIRVDLSNGTSVNSEFISTFDLAYIADFIEGYTKEKLGNA